MSRDWTNEETRGLAEQHVAVRAATLTVVKGPDAGASVHIDGPTITLGKGPLAGFRLTDSSVSREHLRVSLERGGIHILDRGSKNGTWIGAVRITSALLTHDTALRLGDTHLELRMDAEESKLSISDATSFGRATGKSVAMRHLFAYLARAAMQPITVLMEGESGVGKEVLARAIHDASPRAAAPFIPVDCGAIPPTLIESELFGHVRGAFTGANKDRVGLFEQASGGTIFLDELGELPLDMQPKLLRVLEQREVRPTGGNQTIRVDVRVIAATNRNLDDEMRDGRFREDLFYRVALARVRVPPLRDRPDDVEELATTFLRELAGDADARFPADILAMLRAYAWPGNVRELKNVVGRFAMLDARSRDDLFDGGVQARRSAGGTGKELSHLQFHEARKITLEQLEAEYIPAVLERAGGVVAKAAEMAGVSRSSFYRMSGRSLGGVPPRDDD